MERRESPAEVLEERLVLVVQAQSSFANLSLEQMEHTQGLSTYLEALAEMHLGTIPGVARAVEAAWSSSRPEAYPRLCRLLMSQAVLVGPVEHLRAVEPAVLEVPVGTKL